MAQARTHQNEDVGGVPHLLVEDDDDDDEQVADEADEADDGEDDLKKGTQLLEVYALEIQMYTAQKNNKKQKVSFI